jgi:ribosome maturation factor RimP
VSRRDFERNIGQELNVKYRSADQKVMFLVGRLRGVEDDFIVLESQGEEIRLEFQSLLKTRIEVKF